MRVSNKSDNKGIPQDRVYWRNTRKGREKRKEREGKEGSKNEKKEKYQKLRGETYWLAVEFKECLQEAKFKPTPPW